MTADILTFTPRLFPERDLDLPHQIDFVKSSDQATGLGCRVSCNCAAVAPQNHVDLAEAWQFYRAHLAGEW